MLHLDQQQPKFREIMHQRCLLPVLRNQPGVMILNPDHLELKALGKRGHLIRQEVRLFGEAVHAVFRDLQLRRVPGQALGLFGELTDDLRIELALLHKQWPHIPLGGHIVPSRSESRNQRANQRDGRSESVLLQRSKLLQAFLGRKSG